MLIFCINFIVFALFKTELQKILLTEIVFYAHDVLSQTSFSSAENIASSAKNSIISQLVSKVAIFTIEWEIELYFLIDVICVMNML